MAIITLTSDMGLKNYYVGAVKGAILREIPDVQIIDITHEIPPFDINEAAFVIKRIAQEFPPNTVHLIAVDTEYYSGRSLVIVEVYGQYFVGPDNGIFSLFLDRRPDLIVEIDVSLFRCETTFTTKSILVPAACHLARGGKPSIIGTPLTDFKQKAMRLNPILQNGSIIGQVEHVDAYGNVFTNIDKENFDRIGAGKKFRMHLSSSMYITELSAHYADVPPGEKLALFGSTGMLEIAINKGVEGSGGGAQRLLGIDINDKIRIEFE